MRRIWSMTSLYPFGWCFVLFMISTQSWGQSPERSYDTARTAFAVALDARAAGNYEVASKIYQQLVDEGSAGAANNLAAFYLHGTGVNQDTTEAIRLFQLSIQRGLNRAGLGHAATSLGWIYLTGIYSGIPRDIEKALHWTLQGAQLGHTNAYSNLAMMYAEGLGVEQDFSIMLGYLIKSAEAFTVVFNSVFEKPDVWHDYVKNAPDNFWEARRIYWTAIQTSDEYYFEQLRSLRH